jgi:hypothetical protein
VHKGETPVYPRLLTTAALMMMPDGGGGVRRHALFSPFFSEGVVLSVEPKPQERKRKSRMQLNVADGSNGRGLRGDGKRETSPRGLFGGVCVLLRGNFMSSHPSPSFVLFFCVLTCHRFHDLFFFFATHTSAPLLFPSVYSIFPPFLWLPCLCVCVCERESERERKWLCGQW